LKKRSFVDRCIKYEYGAAMQNRRKKELFKEKREEIRVKREERRNVRKKKKSKSGITKAISDEINKERNRKKEGKSLQMKE
jgi:hypothetical protein